MQEFRGFELKSAREAAKFKVWQAAQLLHVSETTLRSWENDEYEPSPDTIDRLEDLYKCPGMWHKWMMSHCDSYRRRFNPVTDTTTTGSIVRNRYAFADFTGLQEAMERDALDNGQIDNQMNREKYIELIKKTLAYLMDTLARLEKRGGAK